LPSHEEHCQESLRRYGKTFSELHKWMDEPCEIMGAKHRIYRHDPYTTPKEAKALFGEYADEACLDHIRADMKTLRRQGVKVARPHGKSELPSIAQGMVLLFLAFALFILGFQGLSIKYGGWMIVLGCWSLAFLFFLGFLATITAKEKEPSTVYHYEVEIPHPVLEPQNEKQNEEKPPYDKKDSENES
jgi:hypothetical protein